MPVVLGVLAQELGQVHPTASDADHDALVFADEADEEFERFGFAWCGEVVEFRVSFWRSGAGLRGGCGVELGGREGEIAWSG